MKDSMEMWEKSFMYDSLAVFIDNLTKDLEMYRRVLAEERNTYSDDDRPYLSTRKIERYKARIRACCNLIQGIYDHERDIVTTTAQGV